MWLRKGDNLVLVPEHMPETIQRCLSDGWVEAPDPRVAQVAAGGVIQDAGLMLVGEPGPESVHIPESAQPVSPEIAEQLKQLAQADFVQVTPTVSLERQPDGSLRRRDSSPIRSPLPPLDVPLAPPARRAQRGRH